MSGLEWLGELAHYLGSWVPHPQRILQPQRGVKLRSLGWFLFTSKDWWTTFSWLTPPRPEPLLLTPGLTWYLPALTEVTIFSIVEDEYPVPSLPTVLRGGVTVCVGGIATVKIQSPRRAVLRCVSVKEKIEAETLRAIHQVVAGVTTNELAEQIANKALEEELTATVADNLRYYGIRVLRVTAFVGTALVLHHSSQPRVEYALEDDS